MLRFLLLWLCFSASAQKTESVQELYITAYKSKENAFNFYQLTEENQSKSPINLAYFGAAKMIYAKYSKNKIELLKDGKTIIENAIKSNPNDVELRFIRLSIQENLPKIVSYRKNIDEDKKYIIENIDNQNDRLKKYICEYIKISKVFSEEEKRNIIK